MSRDFLSKGKESEMSSDLLWILQTVKHMQVDITLSILVPVVHDLYQHKPSVERWANFCKTLMVDGSILLLNLQTGLIECHGSIVENIIVQIVLQLRDRLEGMSRHPIVA